MTYDYDEGRNIKFKEESYYLGKFNYIHGPNGCGKTMMLRVISKKFKSVIYDPNIINEKKVRILNALLELADKERVRYYLESIDDYGASLMDRDYYSDTQLSLLYMCAAMAFGERSHKEFLLFDNIYWDNFDYDTKTVLVETLDDYPTPVVLTGCTDNTLQLVKTISHHPNIIRL